MGPNRFAYGFGNPVNFTDRSGLNLSACWMVITYLPDGAGGEYAYLNWSCPDGGGGGGGGGRGGGGDGWAPGFAPSNPTAVPVHTSPSDPPERGGTRTPACKPSDPNCDKTECKPGDPNCDKRECRPGEPGCNQEPPACQPRDPGCTAGPEPERPRNAHAPEQPLPFRDPCATGFWDRGSDDMTYLNEVPALRPSTTCKWPANSP